jgi:sulfite dehydrogenase (quinone) subunit SoeA
VIDAPGDADDGLFARDEAGEPLVLDSAGGLRRARPGVAARVFGEATLARRAPRSAGVPAARRALSRPDATRPRRSPTCGIPPSDPGLAAEIAASAFERGDRDRPAVDRLGRPRHATMRGRPVAIHAMRGISAHSNGFQTCRALHLLQVLIGTIDVPGGFRYKPPYPKPAPPGHLKPAGKAGQVEAGHAAAGPPLGFR